MNIQDSTSSSSTALIHATRGSSRNMDVYGHGLSHYQFLLAGDVPKNPGVEVIEYLLKHEANACDKEADSEKSVLMMAVSNGDKAIVPALLTSGAAVDIQTRPLKESAITLAVDNGKAEICKILLQHGVDLSLTDSTGRTIAHHIARAANFEILSYFLPYDEIDWKRSEGAEFHDFERRIVLANTALRRYTLQLNTTLLDSSKNFTMLQYWRTWIPNVGEISGLSTGQQSGETRS
jgi:ankyrin repeat protein